jgi:2,4-diacetamido-2,4,6-trideoxy-beta-L-gulose transferase
LLRHKISVEVYERIMSSVYIIAEAGVNHNGNSEMAFQLVDAAALAGADAVKFQTFIAEKLVTKSVAKTDYQKQATDSDESQFAMLKRLELAHNTHHELIDHCEEKGIEFLSTAFDFESLDFLVNDLGLKTLKIPSGEITNGPLLLAHAQTGCNLILSTGMATLGEVEEALGVLAFGLLNGLNSSKLPSRAAFQLAFFSEAGQQVLKKNVTILHCTTEYPAPPQDINLNAMITMRKNFGLKTGYSDHSAGITVPIAAVAMGAILIEKHFTLDKTLAGPDHKASLEPDELTAMVSSIRTTEQVMGSGIKQPMLSELKNIPVVRRSLVASQSINEGNVLTRENMTVKRPGTGISPMDYWDLLGSVSHQSYSIDEVIVK